MYGRARKYHRYDEQQDHMGYGRQIHSPRDIEEKEDERIRQAIQGADN